MHKLYLDLLFSLKKIGKYSNIFHIKEFTNKYLNIFRCPNKHKWISEYIYTGDMAQIGIIFEGHFIRILEYLNNSAHHWMLFQQFFTNANICGIIKKNSLRMQISRFCAKSENFCAVARPHVLESLHKCSICPEQLYLLRCWLVSHDSCSFHCFGRKTYLALKGFFFSIWFTGKRFVHSTK